MQYIKYSLLHVRLFLWPEKMTGVPISQTQPQQPENQPELHQTRESDHSYVITLHQQGFS